MTEPNDFNATIIEEFRASGGKVGGMFANSNLPLRPSTGAKSGAMRISPLGYQKAGDDYAPNFAEYEKKTDRQIPVVILEPAR